MIKVQIRNKLDWTTTREFPATPEGMKYALIDFKTSKPWERRILWDDVVIDHDCTFDPEPMPS